MKKFIFIVIMSLVSIVANAQWSCGISGRTSYSGVPSHLDGYRAHSHFNKRYVGYKVVGETPKEKEGYLVYEHGTSSSKFVLAHGKQTLFVDGEETTFNKIGAEALKKYNARKGGTDFFDCKTIDGEDARMFIIIEETLDHEVYVNMTMRANFAAFEYIYIK